MIKRAASPVRKRPARSRRAAWALARVLLCALTAMVEWLRRSAPGSSPTGLVRFVQQQTAMVEHIFRCLLILMRAAPAAPKPAPFQPALKDAAVCAPSTRPKVAPGFLSLSQIAGGFARYGGGPPARQSFGRAVVPAPRPIPRGPTASAPVADPLEILAARLGALRAVLADPRAHAARLAALLKLAGLTPRARLPQLPDAAFWLLCNYTATAAAAPAPGPRPDTS